MFDGNWATKAERCLLEDAFKSVVQASVVRPQSAC